MQQQMTAEQVKALQEKIKNMSPEELRQFQKQQCIFCNIINGKIQSKKVYEDENVLAILDINPANPGHVLLMPKEHYAIMPLITKDELDQLSYVTKAISQIMLKALKAEGVTIFIANGIAAGQKAQHFMIHIIPRKENDKLPLDIPSGKIKDLDKVREKIQADVNKIFKIKEEKKSENKPKEVEFIGSKAAKRYHTPECRFAKMISVKNKIIVSLEDIKEKKLVPCKCVKSDGKKKSEKIDLDSIAGLLTK